MNFILLICLNHKKKQGEYGMLLFDIISILYNTNKNRLDFYSIFHFCFFMIDSFVLYENYGEFGRFQLSITKRINKILTIQDKQSNLFLLHIMIFE